jgi:hypothetical protein
MMNTQSVTNAKSRLPLTKLKEASGHAENVINQKKLKITNNAQATTTRIVL